VPIELVPYDDEWPHWFEREAALLRSVMGEAAVRVEHVGSTSIVGMAAKPKLDMVAAVESLEDARRFIAPLLEHGYHYRDDPDVPSRLYFSKSPSSEPVHLSLTEIGSNCWRDQVYFRDYLRVHPEAADEYRRLKESLAEEHADEVVSYCEGKTSLVQRIVEKALKEGA